MKVLNLTEANSVAGGSYEMTLNIFVPNADDLDNKVFDVFQQIVTGQIVGMDQFINAIYSIGPVGNEIRLEAVKFSQFS